MHGSTVVNACDLPEPQAAPTSSDSVSGIEDQKRQQLLKLQAIGMQWTHPEDKSWSVVFRLPHGGDVAATATACSRLLGRQWRQS
ncbi:hypothetical protein Ancab_018237 [Ancistrocladus abbreviatus]